MKMILEFIVNIDTSNQIIDAITNRITNSRVKFVQDNKERIDNVFDNIGKEILKMVEKGCTEKEISEFIKNYK